MIKNSKGEILEMKYINICPLHNMGLSNQIYTLVGCLVWCIKNNIRVTIVSNFLLDISQNSYCSSDKVFCLSSINQYLKNKYKINIVDITKTRYVNRKEELGKYLLKFNIPQCSDLINTDLGKDILSHLLFTPNLVSVPMKFLNSIVKKNTSSYNNIHVIHLRIEDDAIEHWSKANKLTTQKFRNLLVNKYTKLIEEHISPNELTILITGSINNEVVSFLKEKKYNYQYLVKQSRYREINAIMDLILGKMCSGIFIGAAGSTFSHILAINHSKDDRVRCHFVNMDNIQ